MKENGHHIALCSNFMGKEYINIVNIKIIGSNISIILQTIY